VDRLTGENYKKTLEGIDHSISTHVKTNKDEGSIVTGWVLVASVQHPESMSQDGYVVQSSASLPHHTQIGLLQMAIEDKRNISMMSTIRAMMGDD
jgi:hypothetical protein